MTTPHKHADVLRAIADGKEVQFKGEYSRQWMDVCFWKERITPITHPAIEWRIKPEPKTDFDVDEFVVYEESCGAAEIRYGRGKNNLRLTFDGETGKLKKAEVIE